MVAHGPREDRAHRPNRRRSSQRRRRRRVRAGARVWSAAGARRVPHERWRQNVDAHAVRRREHRVLGRRDGREQPAHSLCGHVAARNPYLGTRQRRARQRPVQVDRRRPDVETPCRSRTAEIAARQDIAAGVTRQSKSRLRADRNRRRHADEPRREDAKRLVVAERRWRRELGARELGSAAPRAHPLLHALRC